MGEKYLIIYHKEDNDGVFSGAIIYDYLVNTIRAANNMIDLLGADYNILNKFSQSYTAQELHEQYKMIIMTDISFNNANFMKELYDEFEHNFIWFDHHAPIIHQSKVNKFCNAEGVRDTTKSAILCAWEWFYNPFKVEENPELLKILSAYDSWTYEENGYDFDYVFNVNKGVISEFNLDFKKILEVVKAIRNNEDIDILNFEGLGKKLNDYDAQRYAEIISFVGDCSWKIYTGDKLFSGEEVYRTACALFIQGPSNSVMFKSLATDNKDDIMNGIVFKRNKDSSWTISLYNIRNKDNTFHCGDYLKKFYKGGGHMGAAGCTVDEKTFIKILKTKTLGK